MDIPYNITRFLIKKKSFLATLVYFSFYIVLISSRNLIADVYLTTFVMAAIYFWLAQTKNLLRVWSVSAFYIWLGLAILAKEPMTLLFVLISFEFRPVLYQWQRSDYKYWYGTTQRDVQFQPNEHWKKTSSIGATNRRNPIWIRYWTIQTVFCCSGKKIVAMKIWKVCCTISKRERNLKSG